MKTAGEIVDSVLRACVREEDDDFRKIVWRELNHVYFSICRQHPWQALRNSVSLDFTAADDTGLWLPTNLMDIERVRDNTDNYEFVRRDKQEAEPDENTYRFYTYVPDSDDLFFCDDCFVAQGDTSFSSQTLGTSDYTGYHIRFGREPGYYKLTAATTFTPRYYGPTYDGGEARIREKGTEKLVILDAGESILKDRTVVVYYWQAPTALYRDSDIPVLPMHDPIELSLYRAFPEAKQRRPVSDRELDAAMEKALKLNPDFPRVGKPRDVMNNPFDFKRPIFGRR